jgi:pimeloyl-ACP methyl ester carboxylesterase
MPKLTSQNPSGYRSPSDLGIPFDSHFIPTSPTVSVHAWVLKSGPDRPTFLFFHGNAGNIGFRLPNAYRMWKLGYNVVMVEYRGYGESPGDPKVNEEGLKRDAEEVLKWCRAEGRWFDGDNMFLFGRSLGGAVAFHLAEYAKREGIGLRGVVVENTFTSISDMVDRVMPIVAPLKGLVLRIGWDSKKIVGKLDVPVLFISGRSDELVPVEQMDELYGLAEGRRCGMRMKLARGGVCKNLGRGPNN